MTSHRPRFDRPNDGSSPPGRHPCTKDLVTRFFFILFSVQRPTSAPDEQTRVRIEGGGGKILRPADLVIALQVHGDARIQIGLLLAAERKRWLGLDDRLTRPHALPLCVWRTKNTEG